MAETVEEIVVAIETLLSSSTILTEEGKVYAVDAALSELNWTLPQTDSAKVWWITKRALRHACYILWVASAQKFKYKQVNLQHRFEHYSKLIADMDREFEKALSSEPSLFSGVDTYKMFGSVVGAGFCYDTIGNDLTYENLIDYINSGV
jgi:hypothetical protein